MKTLLEYVAEVADESNPVNTILSVAELIRSQSESENKVAKLHMQAFLTMLRNAGLSIDYEGLLAYFEAEPNLKNKIQQFNDREIVFVAQGDEVDSETLGQPQADIPPEEKVEKMAKRAMKAREGIELDEEEQLDLDLGLLDRRKSFRHPDLAKIVDDMKNLHMAYAIEMNARDIAKQMYGRRIWNNLSNKLKEKYRLDALYEIYNTGTLGRYGRQEMPTGWLPEGCKE